MLLKHTAMAMLGVNLDCYVRLDILSEQQIALLCRPPIQLNSELIDVPEPAAFVEIVEENDGWFNNSCFCLIW